MRDWTEIARSAGSLCISSMGSFHVGGHWKELHGAQPRMLRFSNSGQPESMITNGQYWEGAMYVQYFFPAKRKGACPLLLWHGGGLCGTFFETTPDGREGWLNIFLRKGWPVFNCDAVERGRAGWMPYEEIQPSKPILNARHIAFERFRIGAGEGSFNREAVHRQPYGDTQFPVHAYDLFVRQQVPRWTDTDAATVDAYEKLVLEVPPCVVIGHSQGGQFALQVAMNNPDRIRALVLVEPSGTCDPDTSQLGNLARVPMLVIHGDHIESNARWVSIRQRTNSLFDQLRAANATIDMLELPKIGQFGNSHLIPIDMNNMVVAEHIDAWLGRLGLHQDSNCTRLP